MIDGLAIICIKRCKKKKKKKDLAHLTMMTMREEKSVYHVYACLSGTLGMGANISNIIRDQKKKKMHTYSVLDAVMSLKFSVD